LALVLHAADSKLTPPMQSILDAISADSLRGHLSFIAFDALEGRETLRARSEGRPFLSGRDVRN
jgi:hypothetical protein